MQGSYTEMREVFPKRIKNVEKATIKKVTRTMRDQRKNRRDQEPE